MSYRVLDKPTPHLMATGGESTNQSINPRSRAGSPSPVPKVDWSLQPGLRESQHPHKEGPAWSRFIDVGTGHRDGEGSQSSDFNPLVPTWRTQSGFVHWGQRSIIPPNLEYMRAKSPGGCAGRQGPPVWKQEHT